MRNQRGAALIVALLVIAIVAAVATTLMSRLQIDIARSSLNFNADKAYLASQEVRDWAIVKYVDIAQAQQQKLPPSSWPIIMPTQPISGGTIVGSLDSAQGRLNLNNLTSLAYQPLLAHLIQYVQPNIDSEQAAVLAMNVTLWLSPFGPATNSAYQRNNPPYRIAHRTMISSSELRLVDGFTADLYQLLAPYIIALPQTATTIDVNAASEAVLIAGGVSPSGAEAVTQYLKSHPGFSDINQFQSVAQFQASTNAANPQVFGITSTFFYAKADVTLGNVYFVGYYLLQYQQQTNSLTVIRYSQGTL